MSATCSNTTSTMWCANSSPTSPLSATLRLEPRRSYLRGVLSFASHGIHDVSATGENSLFWRVTGGRCGLAFHPLPLDAAALCIASCNSTTAFFLSTEASAFRGQLEEPKVRDFADSQVHVRPCLVPGGRSCSEER